ncbi:hypothetical protein RND71_007918 [Anisodus tanguticus]|uniref:Uncharacterized protein n=1 Tax=Anisodus tanguticus TaxID=243964 RepID=A0AAE1VTF1_9SOLA|nr:hypothetical protein RND71_007918 [Anisodus tanguticus]
MDFHGNGSEKCSNYFLSEASGDSHQSDNSKVDQENFDEANVVEDDDAESSSYESKDNLGNSQEVITSGFEELICSNEEEEEEYDGHKVLKESKEEKEQEQDGSSSYGYRAVNVEDEVERNRLFWETCFEVGYP